MWPGAGPPQKVGERVVRQTPLRAKEPVSQLLAVLRLGELPGLDPVPANFVAAATLACAPPMGPPQQVRTPPAPVGVFIMYPGIPYVLPWIVPPTLGLWRRPSGFEPNGILG